MKKLGILIIVSLLATAAFTATLKDLNIDPLDIKAGARPLAMGGAFSSLDDVNADFYNPAGLAWSKGIELNIRDAANLSVAQAYPGGKNASLGLAVLTNKYSSLRITASAEATASSTFVGLGFGTKLNFLPGLSENKFFQHFSIGLNIKALMNQTLRQTGSSDMSGNGVDLDAGILWKGAEWWNVGMVGQNILPANMLGAGILKWNNGSSEGFASSLKLAGSARIFGDINEPIFVDDKSLLVAGEMIAQQNSPMLLRLGLELGFSSQFFIRTGMMQQLKSGSVSSDITYGLGMRREDWGADVASYTEIAPDERVYVFSFLYFPKEWVVVEKLDVAKPSVLGERPFETLSLEDNFITFDDKLNVAGKVKAGVSVYVNDAAVALSSDSAFAAIVPLKLGKNVILVEARYAGEKKVWKYKVLRKVKVQVPEENLTKTAIAAAKDPAQKQTLEAQLKNIIDTKEQAESLVTMGIIEITPEAQFSIDAGITRGELCAWLVKSLGAKVMKPTQDLYKDVPKDHPLAPYIKVAVDLNILKPYPDGTFRPDNYVSKQEGQAIFSRFGAK